MRRYRLFAFLLVVALMPPLFCQAAEQTYNIQQLKEQAARGWTKTYEACGRTIKVDIAIDVPDVASFPALQARSLHPSSQSPVQRLGQDGAHIINGVSVNNNERSFIYSKPDAKTLAKLTSKNRSPEHLTITTSTLYAQQFKWDESYAHNNPATIQDAHHVLSGIAETYFPEETPSFLPWKVVAGVSAQIEDFEKNNGSHQKWTDFTGSLTVYFHQTLHSIPVICTAENGFRQPRGDGSYPLFVPDLNNRVSLRPLREYTPADTSEKVVINALKEQATLAADLPLCDLDTVIAAYEQLILEGKLRQVDSLRLGYVGWHSAETPDTLTLLPFWALQGILVQDGTISEYLEGTDVQVMNTETSTVLVNAQTGELVNPWSTEADRARIPKIISWP